MAYTKTLNVSTNHTMHVSSIKFEDLPMNVRNSPDAEGFDRFYVVRNWDKDGVVFFYLAKGSPAAPHEICGFYRHSGKFWNSFGNSIQEAVEGMIRDGWMYA